MTKEELYKDKLAKVKNNFDEIYNFAFHQGRHTCRRKYVESHYLVIDPEKKEQLLKDCEDPCIHCEKYEPSYKMGCISIKTCKKKEKQFTAIEIKKYFLHQ